jgi:hypothetical protein
MAMTKKDYELIARCISNARYDKKGLAPEFQQGVDAVAMWLDIQLAAANPRYNSETFLSKAQYGKRPRVSETEDIQAFNIAQKFWVEQVCS